MADITEAVPNATRYYENYSRPWIVRVLASREAAVILGLALVILVASLSVRNFVGPLTTTYLFLDIAPILLIALPMTLIIITGEIDLSVASIVGLSSVTLGVLHQGGMDIPVAAVAALLVGAVAGAINGFLITVVGLPSLAVTIGTLALYRGLAVGLLGTTAVTEFTEFWTDLAKAKIPGTPIPMIVLVILALAIAFGVLLHLTPFGRGIYAIGLSPEAARFSGIRVERTKFILFVLSGLVSALAGIYYTLRFSSARGDNAAGLELSVIAAVMIGGVSIFGGKGSILGPIAGAVLIGVLASALRLANVTSDVINIITGTLLVASVVGTSFLAWMRSKRARPGGKKAGVPATAKG
ncbi:ABC transporter permease [soil metagenome]